MAMVGMTVIVGLIFAAFGVAAYRAVRSKSWRVLGGIVAVIAGFSIWMGLEMNAAKGWDGLLYLIALMFGAAPAAVGTGGGSLVAVLRAPKLA